MGSDSKVSCGTASEDVGVLEVEGRVQRVFEQEVWRREVIDAVLEPEIEAVPERGVVTESLMLLLVEAGGN